MAVSGNPGLAAILAIDACIHDGFVGFRELSKRLLPEYFYFYLMHFKERSSSLSVGAVFKNLTTEQIKNFDVPVPSIDAQKQIVNALKFEMDIVRSNSRLIEIFEGKIKERIDRVWGVGKVEKEIEMVEG